MLAIGCKKNEDEEVVIEKGPEPIVEVEALKDPDEIMKEFYEMINGDEKPNNVATFISNSIENLEEAKADTMILDYEAFLIQDLNVLLKEYEKANSNPELSGIFDLGVKDNISDVKDTELKDLLNKTLDNGYILLKGGGYIYPEINYAEILKYKEYISEKVTDYLEILDLETKNRFTYGGAVEIPLKNLLARAFKAEKYLESNKDSRSSNKIYELYVEYINGTILGTGNPYVLANEGTSIIKDEILNEYKIFVENNRASRTAEFLQEYLDVLEGNENAMDATEVVEFYDNRDSNIKGKFIDLGL